MTITCIRLLALEFTIMKTETTHAWIPCKNSLPPEGKIVMTKIDDANGCRNEQPLKRSGHLWFFPDGSMYVYYTPTHWANLEIIDKLLSEIEKQAKQHTKDNE